MKAKVTDIRDLPAVQPENELIERIQRRIEYLYGAKAVPRIMQRLTQLLHEHLQKRPRPVSEKYWTQEDIALITYGDAVRSVDTMPLQTLHSFLNKYLMEEFSMVHLLSIFPWSSDDGFSVTDFRAIDPQLGSWNDVVAFDNEYDLIFDLILNHCSRKNQWFTDYIEGTEPACNYFIEVDPKTDLSKVTRPRTSPLLSEVGTHKGLRHVWTTFSSDQVDMNFSNPDVLLEFIDILLHYYRREARVVRLDAVAYLWKQVGTNCIHLRQTHQIVKLLRDVLDIVEPEALIMTETNVPHAENISYFGDGDEAHLIYQFSLPPLLLHALYAGNTRYLNQWALELEASEPPPGCTYFNFHRLARRRRSAAAGGAGAAGAGRRDGQRDVPAWRLCLPANDAGRGRKPVRTQHQLFRCVPPSRSGGEPVAYQRLYGVANGCAFTQGHPRCLHAQPDRNAERS